MTHTDDKQRWRTKLAEQGYKRVEVRLSPALQKRMAKDKDHATLGNAGVAMKAIEAYYGSKK